MTPSGGMTGQSASAGGPGDWIMLSGMARPLASPLDVMERGTLVVEVALPLIRSALILDHRRRAGWPRAFSLTVEPAGLVVTHLQGRSLMRHILPGPLPTGEGIGRVSFAWDAPLRLWTLRYEIAGRPETALAASGAEVMPPLLGDLLDLCAGQAPARHHATLLWAGLSGGLGIPEPRPWIGLRCTVETPVGPVAAGLLRPGDTVLTADTGLREVRAVRRVVVPARGSLAPVLLRAPYFGLTADLQVGADQHVLCEDVAVEYLFGEDRVLVRAGDLADGLRALPDRRRAIAQGVEIDLGAEALVMCDGVALSSAAAPRDRWGRAIRRLDRHEAQALAGLRRTRGRNLAA